MMSFSPAALAAALMLPLAVAQNTIVDVALGSGVHNTLVTAVVQAGLVDTLSGEGPLTVFAPTDDAFAEVDSKYLEDEWISHLIDILTYHVTPGNVTSSMLSLGATVDMVNMESAEITSLTPPMINQATITGPDIFADNGVVHVIDSVLLPASATSNIVEVASSTPQLSMLANLVVAGGLASTLSGEGPFTVFAPTNEAFSALDNETVAFLTSPEGMDDLVNILTYHVASGIVTSNNIVSGPVTMVNGADIAVTVPSTLPEVTQPDSNITMVSRASEGTVMINDAEVIAADILVNNGVVHLINKVLLPPAAVEPTDPVTDPIPVDPTPNNTVPEGTEGGLVPDGIVVGSNGGFVTSVNGVPVPGVAPAPVAAPMFDVDEDADDKDKDDDDKDKDKDEDEDKDKDKDKDKDEDDEDAEGDMLSQSTGGTGEVNLGTAIDGAFIGEVTVTSSTTTTTTTNEVPAPAARNMGM